ncbi:MAG: AsmA-like C-terminal region-containing protein [Bacteroidales bacterium]
MIVNGKHKNIKKYIIRILLGVLIFLLLGISIGFLVIYYNQDTIKQLFVAEINKSLQTEISVKDIEFSVFDKFPNASLCFTKVVAKDALKAEMKDTLLKAESVFLEFNIMDLYYKQYRIKNIELNDAVINLKIDKDGNDNFHCWKSEGKQTSSKFEFNLKNIKYNNVRIKYINKQNLQYYDILVKDGLASGNFSNDIQTVKMKGNLQIHHFQSEDIVYLSNAKASVDLEGNINTQEESVDIQKADVLINDLRFDVKGKVTYAASNKSMRLFVKGKDIQLHHFIKELPQEQQQYFKDYQSKGIFDFSMEISGNYGGALHPAVTANFNFHNGEIFHTKTKARLMNVNIQGSYSNSKDGKAENSQLNIQQFSCNLKSGKINGRLSIIDFNNPYINCSASVSLDLHELHEFINNNKIQSVQGNMAVDFNFKGKINKNALKVADFINSQTTGQAIFSNVNIQFKNDSRTYSTINGKFQFTNNDIEINTLTGNISGSDFRLQGYFRNVIPFLLLDMQKIEVNANLISNNLDLDAVLGTQQIKTGNREFSLSENYTFNLTVNAEKIKFKKFKASHLKGLLTYNNKLFKAEQLSMESMNGSINGKMMVDGSQSKKFQISCDANVSKVNARELFYVFDNFGQNSLTFNNIEGSITANVQFTGLFNALLQPDKKTICSTIKMKIENGKLINYQPILKLSRFIDIEDLKEVSFKTLQNEILIKDETIYIPAMDISSTAVSLGIYGQHKFNNVIDYHINILLSELNSKKRKIRKQQKAESQNEFGFEEDDGLGRTKLFLKVSGTIDMPVFKYDSKSLKDKILLDLKKEKQNLNKILKEEFNWLQRDSSDIIQQQRFKIQEKGKYIIDWEEDAKEKPVKQHVSDTIPSSKIKIKWEEE